MKRSLKLKPGIVSAGFTIVELLIVMTLLALAIGIAAANLEGGTARAKLDAEARRVTKVLSDARTGAIKSGLVTSVVPGDEPNVVRTLPGGDEIYLSDDFSVSLSPGTAGPTGRFTGIQFYPDGSASGGRVSLKSEAGVEEIAVNWLTGEIAIADDPET